MTKRCAYHEEWCCNSHNKQFIFAKQNAGERFPCILFSISDFSCCRNQQHNPLVYSVALDTVFSDNVVGTGVEAF